MNTLILSSTIDGDITLETPAGGIEVTIPASFQLANGLFDEDAFVMDDDGNSDFDGPGVGRGLDGCGALAVGVLELGAAGELAALDRPAAVWLESMETSLEERLAPFGPEWQLEQLEREAGQ